LLRRRFLAALAWAQAVRINAPFVTTPPELVEAMLKLAEVGKGD
jgi:hypothetical protein